MGAWGHDYFDNDNAQDLLCNLRSVVEKELRKIIFRKGFNSNYYEEVIAASALIAQQGEACGISFPPITSSPYRFFDLVEPAAEKIQKICNDTDWITGWDSREAKYHALDSLWHRLKYMQAEQENRNKKRAEFAKKHPRRIKGRRPPKSKITKKENPK